MMIFPSENNEARGNEYKVFIDERWVVCNWKIIIAVERLLCQRSSNRVSDFIYLIYVSHLWKMPKGFAYGDQPVALARPL